MARFALFSLEGSPLHEAIRRGVWSLGRHDVIPQNAPAWSPAQERGEFDGAFIHGARGRSGDIARWHLEHGRPVVMIDLPHLRKPGQFRVTPPCHSWLPELPVAPGAPPLPENLAGLRKLYARELGRPAGRKPRKTIEREILAAREPVRLFGQGRLDALGIELGAQPRTKGQGVCLLGQLGGDASHGMSRGQFQEWATEAVGKIRALDPSPIVWREHPQAAPRWAPAGVDRIVPPGETLAETLAGCWRVVTYCSTAGLEALIQGLDVVAEGPAVYGSLAGRLDRWAATERPTPEALRALLVRVAHTQWTLDEIASGEAFRHLDIPGT